MSRTTVKLSARDYNKAISPAKLSGQITNKNIIINGAMTVSQRSTSETGVTGSGYQTVDRFRPSIGTAGTWTITQATDVPSGQGFANSLKLDCTTANSSLSAGSDMALQYRMEGQDLQLLKKGTSNAVSVTISFWVKSTKTGTFICELQDNDNSRNISKAYTVSTTNTWEKKELTFAGDTTGAFGNDNAKSLTILWWLVAGSNYTSGTLATSWVSPTNANRAVGQANIADNTSNDWLITGVQMEIGDKATDFEHEPYERILAKCQRYYHMRKAGSVWSYFGAGQTDTTTVGRFYFDFPVEMNHPPALEQSANNTFATYATSSNVWSADATINNPSTWGSAISATVASGQTAGRGGSVIANNNINAYIAFESEL